MQRIEHHPNYATAHHGAQQLVPASELRRMRINVWLLVGVLIAVMLLSLASMINAASNPAPPAAAQQPVIIRIDSAAQRQAPSQPRNRYDTKMIADAERLGITGLWQTTSGAWRGMCYGRRRQRVCEWSIADRVWEVEVPGVNPNYQIWSNR